MRKHRKNGCRAALAALVAAASIMIFSAVPQSAYAAGKTAELIIDGKVVAEYTDTNKAWSEATAKMRGGSDVEIKLYANWKPSACVEISRGHSMTLDLNGFIVDRGLRGSKKKNGCVFRVNDGGAFMVKDSAPESKAHPSVNGGVITGGAGDNCGGGVQIGSDARFTMTGGSIVACVTDDHGGAIRINGSGAVVDIENAGFVNNRTDDSWDNCHGGAIYGTDGCSITIKNSTFRSNFSEDNGGAIYMNDGSLCVSRCTFDGNKCKDDGGAIYLSGKSSIFSSGDMKIYEIVDSTFKSNSAEDYGGAIACDNVSHVAKLFGDTFSGNSCGEKGGAVYVDEDNVCIADSTISGNNASELGGGVFVDSLSDISLKGCDVIVSNTRAGKQKDNLYISKGTASAAHIFDGGLTDGSEVWVGTKSGVTSYQVVAYASEYQLKYFHSDDSSLKPVFNADPNKAQTEYLIASTFGGSVMPVIIAAALVLAAAVIAVIMKNRGAKRGKADEEE